MRARLRVLCCLVPELRQSAAMILSPNDHLGNEVMDINIERDELWDEVAGWTSHGCSGTGGEALYWYMKQVTVKVLLSTARRAVRSSYSRCNEVQISALKTTEKLQGQDCCALVKSLYNTTCQDMGHDSSLRFHQGWPLRSSSGRWQTNQISYDELQLPTVCSLNRERCLWLKQTGLWMNI